MEYRFHKAREKLQEANCKKDLEATRWGNANRDVLSYRNEMEMEMEMR